MQALESSVLLDPVVVPEYAAPFISAGVPFKETAFYLHVGEKVREQGWILHISVVLGKYFELMEVILPELLIMGVAFKVVKNSKLHEGINNGEYGEGNVGRVISLFLTDELAHPSTINALQEITKYIPGPKIYSAFRVGSNLYIRYGSYVPDNGVDDYGGLYPRFMDKFGKWIIDELKFPPKIPSGISNPFQSLISSWPTSVIQNPLRSAYYIKDTLISRLGLVVYSGKMKMGNGTEVPCWIKRGKMNTVVDRYGKDGASRITSEHEIMLVLENSVFMPKILDFWMDEDNAFLITSIVDGRPLDKSIKDIMADQKWFELSDTSKTEIVHYLITLAEILNKVDTLGFQISGCSLESFMVDYNENIYLIDLSCIKPKSNFSALQIGREISYLFLSILTDFPFSRLPQLSESQIQRIILSLTHDIELSILINGGISKFSHNYSFLKQIQIKCQPKDLPEESSLKQITGIIQSGINGLASDKQLIDDLWFTSVDNKYDPETYRFSNKHIYISLNNGVGGVLYTLCFARKCGFNISQLRLPISRSWDYINSKIKTNIDSFSPGLYNGLSGIAVLYSIAVENEMLEIKDSNKYLDLMHKSILKENKSNHISNGIAGDGMAIMQFENHLPNYVIQQKLESITGHLIRAQQNDGGWAKRNSARPGEEYFMGFGSGAAGIIYFLLEIWKRYAYERALSTAIKGLNYLTNTIKSNGNQLFWPTSNLNEQQTHGFLTGSSGIALAYLKSFEYTEDPEYLSIAETALRSIPSYNLETNLTFMNGITGLGEIYLEAYKITRNSEWQNRASQLVQWICSLSIHESPERLYWISSSSDFTFGTLLQGNSGILHFLIRYLYPNSVPLTLMLNPYSNSPAIKT